RNLAQNALIPPIIHLLDVDTPFQQHSDGSNAFASSKYIITLLIAMFGSRQTFQHCTHLVFCDSIKKLCALKQR
ncbi:MAG: hypothetical protein SO122_04005, partial [Eubacteriales bacterium]|nr:hypothetical protein [Eubacteriales bacterium]